MESAACLGGIHDGVKPVCDGHDGGAAEVCAYGLLDECVCLAVHACCCLIKHQHLWPGLCSICAVS